MRQLLILLLVVQLPFVVFSQKKATSASSYFPPAHRWEKKWIRESGFDSAKLEEAIRFAREKESRQPRNQEVMQAMTFGKEPFGEGIGPFAERGDAAGLVIHKGYIIAQWGDPGRVDMTHSVTKSFLSTVVGLAVDKGLIRSVDDTVAPYIPPIEVFNPSASRPAEEFGTPQLLYPFATAHNRTITWDHLLRQTSDWEGTLWGKPEWADRPDSSSANWINRKRLATGTVWEYNDVRVNALALAATAVWRKPLPQVLKEGIMDKIGASNTWRWTGYRNAWIVLDGQVVQSVSGGGHWGGGMFINAYDMARFGLLTLHRGAWNGQQLISESWIRNSTTPTSVRPMYGYMNFFLNTDKKYLPSAPASAYAHIGNGTNMIYVDPEHNLVVVARWIENNALDGLVKRVLEAFK
jgi:CubicO group peptidase (beta-lactamase class C family)